MSRTNSRTALSDPVPPSVSSEPPEGGDQLPGASDELAQWQEEERIREILNNEENAGGKLEIYRKDTTGRWAYLTMLALEDWNAEARQALAREFGGGDYKARVRRAGGSFGASFQFAIDRNIKPRKEAEDGRPSDMLELVRMQKQESGSMLPLMLQMMQQQQAMFVAQQQQMTQVMVAALTRAPAPGGGASLDKVVEILVQKALTPAPPVDLSRMIAALKDLRELGGGRASSAHRENPAPADDGFWPAVMAQLPNLLQMVLQAQGAFPDAPPAAPPVAPLPPPRPSLTATAPVETPPAAAPAAPPPPPVPSAPEAQRADENRQALRTLLDLLLPQAVAGTDPLAVAAQLSEKLDDGNFTALVVVLERPDWLALLADVHDGVMMHSNWFIRWRDALLAEFGAADA